MATSGNASASVPADRLRESIWRRKADLVYLLFFVIHVAVMLCVDLVSLYPASLTPQVLLRLRRFYNDTYQDKYFTDPTYWGVMFLVMEAVYHLPLSLWAIRALIQDHPLIPLHLLVWAVQTAVTTLTCLADLWSWPDRTVEQKKTLTSMYGPYALFAIVLGLDMLGRLKGRLLASSKAKAD
ncbi:hypothetical protein KEM52_004979 [Ascosphaera acerosa]|nr:hypothetical protein KEM52_004979 [Ascosphaera acerosa]